MGLGNFKLQYKEGHIKDNALNCNEYWLFISKIYVARKISNVVNEHETNQKAIVHKKFAKITQFFPNQLVYIGGWFQYSRPSSSSGKDITLWP